MKPEISYTIWFTQRTGSTLLCKALESTGIAGQPEEIPHIIEKKELLQTFEAANSNKLKEKIWQQYSTPNGVLGVKISYYQPYIKNLLSLFKDAAPQKEYSSRVDIWENIFPDCKHIFMTRRNKVRLAVSWWKAIQTGKWHGKSKEKRKGTTKDSSKNEINKEKIKKKYNYDAINTLYKQSVMREAGIQEFFSEKNIIPYTITYEDFVKNYEATVTDLLDFLNINENEINIGRPYYEKLADDISENWVQRFRKECQKNWDNKAW